MTRTDTFLRLRAAGLLAVAAVVLVAAPAMAADSIKFTDGKKTVSIELPRTFKTNKDYESVGKIAAWLGDAFGGNPDTTVQIEVNPTFQRGRLAYSATGASKNVVEGSVREGEGFFEYCENGTRGSLKLIWRRQVERGGRLCTLTIGTTNPNYDAAKAVIIPWLDSFVLTGGLERKKLDDDFKRSKAKGLDVWTDDDDKSAVEQVVKLLGSTPKSLSKILKGKPFLEPDVRVLVFRTKGRYERAIKVFVPGASEFGAYAAFNDTIYVDGSRLPAQNFSINVRLSSARTTLHRYIGGRPPTWLQRGLSRYGAFLAEAGGKKFDKQSLERMKMATYNAKPLDEWFTADFAVGDPEKTADELWAWVTFLVQGKGVPKDAKKCLQEYIRTLRETGDAVEAAKVWDEVDFSKLTKALKKTADKW